MRGSFVPGRLEHMTVPMSTVRSVGLLNEYKGRQQLHERQSPQVLNALREMARVQSIESSNRIAGRGPDRAQRPFRAGDRRLS
jgi:uncharacterized protein (DUF58 family)